MSYQIVEQTRARGEQDAAISARIFNNNFITFAEKLVAVLVWLVIVQILSIAVTIAMWWIS